MARDDLKTEFRDLAGLVGQIVGDAERLLEQHVQLVRSEVRRGWRQVPPAVAAIGAGAGLVAVGGVLGSLMLVHGLHKSTRIPLWGCYGLVGGAMATAGAALAASGLRRAAAVEFVPRETIAALREDVEWLKDQITSPTS